MSDSAQITCLLLSAKRGDQQAHSELVASLYQELRQLAHCQMRRTGHTPTLCTTAVVNEAYLKLFDKKQNDWSNRRHFFACAALAMRQLLIDYARRRQAGKRSAEVPMPTLIPQAIDDTELPIDDLLELDQALQKLEALDSHLNEVVHLRFFSGLTVDEVSELYNCSSRTVIRDWRKARAFLNAAAA